MDNGIIFLTFASTLNEPAVNLVIDSLRSFGGELAKAPFWVFAEQPEALHSVEGEQTHLFRLVVPSMFETYPFGRTITACAQAEGLVPAGTSSLVWIDPCCLFAQPPMLFVLGHDFDAAFRPVHIQNVGLPPTEPLDAFWQGIYNLSGLTEPTMTVTSFVDNQCLRAYFNSHAFAINPALGLMNRWYLCFQQLVKDQQFQITACADERHQIFLFQAILSALVASTLGPGRLRILPPTYSYPYNLHLQIPIERRAAALNDLVCVTYEDRNIHPASVTDIQIRDPLRAWLEAR